MTLVALGVLLGMVGLVWMLVLEITQADHQPNRQSPREQDNQLVEVARCESKVAHRVSVRLVRQEGVSLWQQSSE